MNILVIGAHGQTGQQVVKKLQADTQLTPIAGVRKKEQMEDFENTGISTRLVDVTGTVDQIAAQINGVDGIVVTVGGSAMLVDLDGKIKVMEAAEKVGVKRLVLVSAGGIQYFHESDRLNWMNDYEEYSAAMYYADLLVGQSQLDYTIVRPGQLSNEAATGKVQTGDYLPHEVITREDLASVIVEVLKNDQTIGKAFDVLNGETAITAAIREI